MFAWTRSLWQFLLKLDQREGCCTAPETRILSFLVGWSVESALDASFHCPSVAATKMYSERWNKKMWIRVTLQQTKHNRNLYLKFFSLPVKSSRVLVYLLQDSREFALTERTPDCLQTSHPLNHSCIFLRLILRGYDVTSMEAEEAYLVMTSSTCRKMAQNLVFITECALEYWLLTHWAPTACTCLL